MLKGLDLQSLAAKIVANQGQKKDMIASTDTLEVQLQAPEPVLNEKTGEYVVDAKAKQLPVLYVPDHGQFPIQPVAHDQIGSHLQIPAKYYDRMLAEQPGLLAANVNTWFRQQRAKPEKRMIRALRGNARAFLSNRYQRIENEEIAEVALPVLYDIPGVQIPSAEVTDRRLYIHFTLPSIQGEVKRGDVVQAGGLITNSEIGFGSVSVSVLLWRLVCLNGLKTQDVFRRNHVGRKLESDSDLDWADDTRQADDRAILLKVRDMVKAAADEGRFQENLRRLQGLTEGEITGKIDKAVEVLAQKLNVTESEQNSILTSLAKGGDLSRWGIVNAVTAQAHEAQSYDRAVEFEALGGHLANLPKDDWKAILEAA